MKFKKEADYTVITGDIIGSSRLTNNDRKNLRSGINKIYKQLQSDFPDSLPLPIDVFRGDSWQFIVTNSTESLRIAICFRLLIKSGLYIPGIDTRISAATGKISFISKNRVSESDGEAFRISGKNLEKLGGREYLNIYVPNGSLQKALDIITSLTNYIITRYTPKQSLAVYGTLTGRPQEEIAKLWKPRISQQMVSRHLKSAGWHVIRDVVVFYENNI